MMIRIRYVLMLCVLALLSGNALAIPTFQVYSSQGIAGDDGPDEDTWFVSSSSFDLIVVGNLQQTDNTLTNVTLVVSVPDASSGSISIIPEGSSDPLAPMMRYSDKDDFLPAQIGDETLNDHYPFQDVVSDFLVFSLEDFIGGAGYGSVHDYNADGVGSTDLSDGSYGLERLYEVSFSGFESNVHFDVYGQLSDGSWKINPGSHDTTAVPAPGAITLGSMGIAIVGWLRRRKSI